MTDPAYGVPTDHEGLLAWTEVDPRIEWARVYWVSTVDRAGRPHAAPVDGLWKDNLLTFVGSPQTRRNRTLEGNPAVCIHLESGSEVVILHGEERLTHADKPFARWLAEATTEKKRLPFPPRGVPGKRGPRLSPFSRVLQDAVPDRCHSLPLQPGRGP